MESTNIRVKLNSVEQVRQFVETMRNMMETLMYIQPTGIIL